MTYIESFFIEILNLTQNRFESEIKIFGKLRIWIFLNFDYLWREMLVSSIKFFGISWYLKMKEKFFTKQSLKIFNETNFSNSLIWMLILWEFWSAILSNISFCSSIILSSPSLNFKLSVFTIVWLSFFASENCFIIHTRN